MSIAPESLQPRDDIKCEDCSAACCRRGMQIILTTKEAFKHSLKMRREIMVSAQPVSRDVMFQNRVDGSVFVREVAANCEVSTLTADCGYLTEDDDCSIHESDDYPASCDAFVPGSEACLYARQQAGIED